MEKGIIHTDNFLSVDDTRIMKAIAICCMLMHHLWSFPARIADKPLENFFTIFGMPSTLYLGFFGKICVPMFFFFGGYGVYKRTLGKKYDVVLRLKKLYFAYWKVFLIFIPIGFLFFSNQTTYCSEPFLCNRFAKLATKELISNFLGFTSTYCREWWFLISYAFALVCFPFVRAIIDRFSTWANIFIAIVVTILLTNIFPGISKSPNLGVLGSNFLYLKFFCQIAPYAACFWMGAVVARNGLLDRLNDSMKSNGLLNPVVDILTWVFIVFLRQSEIGDKFDIFFIPVLTVTGLDLFRRIKWVRAGLVHLGKQSTNMWLIHPFFCYYYGAVAKAVSAPRYAVLSLLVLIALTYLGSVFVTLFWLGADRIYSRVKHVIHKRFEARGSGLEQ